MPSTVTVITKAKTNAVMNGDDAESGSIEGLGDEDFDGDPHSGSSNVTLEMLKGAISG